MPMRSKNPGGHVAGLIGCRTRDSPCRRMDTVSQKKNSSVADKQAGARSAASGDEPCCGCLVFMGWTQNAGMSTGNPTRIKNRAKACAKCSRYGGKRRGRGDRRTARSLREVSFTPKTVRKSTTKKSVSSPGIVQRFSKW
jgi:hypothetical protein